MEIRIKLEGEDDARMVDIDDPAQRSIIGQYWGQVGAALSGKNNDLDRYSRYAIEGKHFDTDIESLGDWSERAEADELEGPY